jgi:hypothetical protein
LTKEREINMKEKYKYFVSNEESWALGCGGGLAIGLIPLMTIPAVNRPAAGALTFLVMLIIIVAIIIFCTVQTNASFDADDTQVTFSHLGRKTVINFNDIKELKLEHRHNERNVKGGVQRCYVETLTITTAVRIYSFSAEMDIDYDKVAQDPASMTAQFENSEFSRLKRYIEEQMNLEKRLRRF